MTARTSDRIADKQIVLAVDGGNGDDDDDATLPLSHSRRPLQART